MLCLSRVSRLVLPEMNENLPAMSEMVIPPAITASVNIKRRRAPKDA